MDDLTTQIELLISYVASASMDRTQLELKTKYPHVWQKVIQAWGTEELSEYLEGLIVVESRVTRKGFSRGAIIEAMKVVYAHDVLYPDYKTVKPQFYW